MVQERFQYRCSNPPCRKWKDAENDFYNNGRSGERKGKQSHCKQCVKDYATRARCNEGWEERRKARWLRDEIALLTKRIRNVLLEHPMVTVKLGALHQGGVIRVFELLKAIDAALAKKLAATAVQVPPRGTDGADAHGHDGKLGPHAHAPVGRVR